MANNNETKATLTEKTLVELRKICVSRGIKGMTKKRKDIVIDAIVAANKAAAQDTGVTFAPPNGGSKKPTKASSTLVKGDHTSNTVTAAQFSMSSILTKPGARTGDKTTTTVQVSCGANTSEFPVVGKSVGAVQEFLKEVLNIDRIAEGQINGKTSFKNS